MNTGFTGGESDLYGSLIVHYDLEVTAVLFVRIENSKNSYNAL